jgi:hypothetical protein
LNAAMSVGAAHAQVTSSVASTAATQHRRRRGVRLRKGRSEMRNTPAILDRGTPSIGEATPKAAPISAVRPGSSRRSIRTEGERFFPAQPSFSKAPSVDQSGRVNSHHRGIWPSRNVAMETISIRVVVHRHQGNVLGNDHPIKHFKQQKPGSHPNYSTAALGPPNPRDRTLNHQCTGPAKASSSSATAPWDRRSP